MDTNQERLFIVLFFTTSLAFLVTGAFILLRENSIKKRGVKTNATIVKRIGNLTVEYETSQGLMRVSSIYSIKPTLHSYEVGDVVDVLYDKNRPRRFIIEGYKTPFIIGALFMFLGVVFLFDGVQAILSGF